MRTITEREYNALSPDFRDVWTTERTDMADWPQVRHQYMGKRTMMSYEAGGTCLLVEGLSFTITPNFEDCGQCGGYGSGPDCEEGSGIPYTCYACSATGRVPYGTHAAERLEMAREAGFVTIEEYDAHRKAINDAWKAELAQREADRKAYHAQVAEWRATLADGEDDIPF